MATHSSILAWTTPRDRGAWRAAWGHKQIRLRDKAQPRGFIGKSRQFQKTSTSAPLTMLKPLLCMEYNKLGNSERDGNPRPPHLPPEKPVCRSGSNSRNCREIGKGICQGCILSPCLFNLYTEYIMRHAGLDEAQTRIKIAGRNNLSYADDTTLIAESGEELKSLLRKVKEQSEKGGLKLNVQKLRSWH